MYDSQVMLNAETSLAGAILVDARCLCMVSKTLKASDFLSEPCGLIYQAARELEAQGAAIDPLTIQGWAQQKKKPLESRYLAELMQITPTCAHAGEYGRLIRQNALRRELYEAGQELSGDFSTPIDELIIRSQNRLADVFGRLEGKERFRDLSQIRYEPPRWLIEPYIQLGKGTLIQADPGVGKTAFACAVAAAVSTGRGFLGLTVAAPGDVVMLSDEDDPGVLRGRIEACGGDLDRIHLMEKPYQYSLNSPEIEEAIRVTQAKLLIFDPFQAFLGSKVDLFRANETRPILARLFDMCAKHDCACLILAHLSKQTLGKSAVNQSLGSVDIPGAMRSILHIVRSGANQEEICAVHIKSSNAPRGKTIAYSIGDRGGVRFRGLIDANLEQLLHAGQTRQEEDPGRVPLVRVIRKLMEEHPQGGYWNYDEFKHEGFRILGTELFRDPRNLMQMLDEPVVSYLYLKLQTQVCLGVRYGRKRGLRLVKVQQEEAEGTDVDDVPQLFCDRTSPPKAEKSPA